MGELVNKFPARRDRTLDVISTNIPQSYDTAEKLTHFGLSDHFTTSLCPKVGRNFNKIRPGVVKLRDTRDQVIEWNLEESYYQQTI